MDAAGGYDETVLGGEWNAHHAEWGAVAWRSLLEEHWHNLFENMQT